jgi:ribonuclease HII
MWIAGIDEAGYGPNLGPLVQAAVAIELRDDAADGWDSLAEIVRKVRGKKDDRIVIDDSKKLYTKGGLAALEANLARSLGIVPGSFHGFLQGVLLPGCLDDLAAEHWFEGEESLPIHAATERHPAFPPCSVVVNLVPTKLFNQIVDGSGSKATVLSCGLTALLGAVRNVGTGPLRVSCDKQGGRNHYAAMLAAAFPDGWVVVELESADESCYRIENLDRPISVTFKPRADGESLAVALASMMCKYLREVCMAQFNRFWAKQVPGIAPTAGYPVDAKRFYAEIDGARQKLNLAPEDVWRSR